MIATNKRQDAIDWLNGKEKSFAEGVEILESSGFKPGVVRRLKTIGDTPVNREHLKENVRLYLQHVGQTVPDTDAELSVFEGKQPQEVLSENKEQMSMLKLSDKVMAGSVEMNDNVKEYLSIYADSYRCREKCHRMLIELGESNDEDIIAKRKQLCDDIDYMTDRLEWAYPVIREYLDNGTIPEQAKYEREDEEKTGNDDESKKDGVEDAALDAMSKEELQKLLRSAKTKILRKNNMLLYQSETKKAKEDPIPDGPKRVKYETAIAKLRTEVEKLEYAIARKG
nr:MAG TPA: hypothetical protein [Caudoviricetes sp.]